MATNRTLGAASSGALRLASAPFGGALEVEPLEGEALRTRFTLRAARWLDQADALPLTYSFELSGAEAYLPEPIAPTYPAPPAPPAPPATHPTSSWAPLSDAGLGPTLATELPEGAAAHGHTLWLRLRVRNVYGALSTPPQVRARVRARAKGAQLLRCAPSTPPQASLRVAPG